MVFTTLILLSCLMSTFAEHDVAMFRRVDSRVTNPDFPNKLREALNKAVTSNENEVDKQQPNFRSVLYEDWFDNRGNIKGKVVISYTDLLLYGLNVTMEDDAVELYKTKQGNIYMHFNLRVKKLHCSMDGMGSYLGRYFNVKTIGVIENVFASVNAYVGNNLSAILVEKVWYKNPVPLKLETRALSDFPGSKDKLHQEIVKTMTGLFNEAGILIEDAVQRLVPKMHLTELKPTLDKFLDMMKQF